MLPQMLSRIGVENNEGASQRNFQNFAIVILESSRVYFRKTLEAEYNNLNLWYFVSFMGGIVTYFSLSFEPSLILTLGIFLTSLLLLFLMNKGVIYRFVVGLLIAFTLGMVIGKLRVVNLDNASCQLEVRL